MQKSTFNCDDLSSSSGVTTDDNNSNENEESQINLNDFLEFLNLSCHVNDMIANSEKLLKDTAAMPPDSSNIVVMKSTSSMAASSNATTSNLNSIPNPNATANTKSEINFRNLAENRLVNNLFGYKLKTDRSGTGAGDAKQSSSAIKAAAPAATSTSSQCHINRGLHPKLNEQLNYVINEGVLDSVLSFICPVPIPSVLTASGRAKAKQAKQEAAKQQANQAASSSAANIEAQNATPAVESPKCSETSEVAEGASDAHNVVRATVKDSTVNKTNSNTNTTLRRKSLLMLAKDKRVEKKEPEVVIHVCDEVKNTLRDFTCPQNLLVSQMGYFADVCAGQRLEEMDISVHCDIQIFDWLMKWVKHIANNSVELQSPTQPTTPGPQLDGSNVVPILVSASFLQMEPLLLECLTFCHAHLSEVVRTSTNLSCLNDAIVTRLAAMFTNLELEMVRDKKERVTPRLWTKLIQSLCEPEPEALRGHFYSMSGLFRCNRCLNCITNTMKSYVNCVPANIRLNRWGQLVSHHIRDSGWDVNAYITQLFKELKSWRKVYWKLWGHCHYLYCCTCEAHFPVYQMNWCRYHPESPNFLGPIEEGRIAGPAGRYACCGQQAFRFETLPGPNGCQFREHSVLVETDRERAILTIAQLVSENNALCENPPTRLQELAAAGDLPPVWFGISLTPQRCRQGLLPQLCMEVSNIKLGRHMRGGNSNYYFESSTDSETSTSSEDDIRNGRPVRRGTARNCAGDDNDDDDDYSTSSDGCESVHRMPKKKKRGNKKKQKRSQTDVPGRFWCGELSARSNQDHQREFEEKVMKQVIAYVNKKTGSDQNLPQNNQPLGGTYVRLEAEWKEQVKQRHSHNHHHGAYPPNNTCLPYSYQPKMKHK